MLLLDRLDHDLGPVPPGEERVLHVAWRRAGPGPLRLLGTRAGCGCVGLDGLPPRLEQGAAGRITLTLRLPLAPGPLDVPVRLVTDAAPPHDVLVLRLRAYVGTQAVARPGWLDLGRRSPGSHVPATVEVWLPPGTPAHVTTELVAWTGEVDVRPSTRPGRCGADLGLLSVLPSRAGPCVGALRIATAAGDVLVPLRAEVVAAPPAAGRAGP